MIDIEIIKGCRNKDSESYKKLYNECVPYVYSIVKRYFNNHEEVKDQVQEVFASVFLSINKFDKNKGTWNTWLRKVSVNQCLMQLRKQKSLPSLSIVELSEVEEIADDIDLGKLTRADIEKILMNMPPGYRMVFMLNVIDGYDHSEISKMLEIKKETSRSQLARAKNWIRKNLHYSLNNTSYGIF